VNDPPLVLVAEDDEDILALIELRLVRAGYDVVTAADGDAAMQEASKRRPDVAVLDVMMPKLDGYEVTRRFRAAPRTWDIPVILVTARVQEADVARCYAAGANDYVHKPFDPEDLLARVQAALDRTQA